MKKILLCLMMVLLVGCTGVTDAQKFKKEYEALKYPANEFHYDYNGNRDKNQ